MPKCTAGNHIIKQRGNRTERFCKAIATVHVVPKKDETNKYGDLERYISDVQISTANEQLSTDYQVKHKQSGIAFRNCIKHATVSAEEQIYLGKETLKCKLLELEQGIIMDPSLLPETRLYNKTDHDRVLNKRTKFEVRNQFHAIVDAGQIDELIDDHLNYFDNSPVKHMETFDNTKNKKKK
eukprot:852106_1